MQPVSQHDLPEGLRDIHATEHGRAGQSLEAWKPGVELERMKDSRHFNAIESGEVIGWLSAFV